MEQQPADAMETEVGHVDPRRARENSSPLSPTPSPPLPGHGVELEPDPAFPPRTEPGRLQPQERDAATLLRRSSYPLNSRKLTTAHLCALAEAIELPIAGSGDQLRQCIEGKLRTEREDPNIVVIIQEVQIVEEVLSLADSDGEFVRTPPIRCKEGPRRETSTSCELQVARAQLQEARETIDAAKSKDAEHSRKILELQDALLQQERQLTLKFEEELAGLERKAHEEKAKLKQNWKTSFEQLAEQDAVIAAKEQEIAELKCQLAEAKEALEDQTEETPYSARISSGDPAGHVPLRIPDNSSPYRAGDSTTRDFDFAQSHVRRGGQPPPTITFSHGAHRSPHGSEPEGPNHHSRTRRGKAPPIEFFSGEDPAHDLDDWLPSLERAADWNGWTADDTLMQLPGYLKGRALQEWHLLSRTDQQSYPKAIDGLRSRLDSTNRTLATQEFRHLLQQRGESVAEYIRRLEKAYQVAYGKDSLPPGTRDALLYTQMYDGLRYEVMHGSAVSGAQGYRELCVAARGEEHRLAALHQRQQFQKSAEETTSRTRRTTPAPRTSEPRSREVSTKAPPQTSPGLPADMQLICYSCGKPGHMAKHCRERKRESRGRTRGQMDPSWAKQVCSQTPQSCPDTAVVTPESLLFSDSDEEGAHAYGVRVEDGGSICQCVKVQVQGVPAYGLIDTGADISIIGGKLFKRVATIARLKKRDFKKSDKVPRTYDQKTFKLDGRMDLDIEFEGRTMRTPLYIKMDAADQLLLSEGVCRQLGVVTFHPSVEKWRGNHRKLPQPCHSMPPALQQEDKQPGGDTCPEEAKVPAVRVNLVQTVHLLPHQSHIVEVSLEGSDDPKQPLLLNGAQLSCGVDVDTSLISVSEDGRALAVLSNPTGCSMTVEEGSCLGDATPAETVGPQVEEQTTPIDGALPPEQTEVDHSPEPATLLHVHSDKDKWRKEELARSIGPTDTLDRTQRQELINFLQGHHLTFALQENERGETDLIEFDIETGDAPPRRCAPRRMPFAVREEVARQLKTMQDAHVIQPSASPWASPVVMVRKKDGSHRFCIDYRNLNAVTKQDTFPLPRIDDLLDQLGKCKYFSTLDLASGYWQIKVAPTSREKTAFTTPQGLFEFLVMPFGLTNAPAVFQRLMQRVLAGLNPDSGPDFVAVYIDDVLVFSRTVEEHLIHLQAVIQRIGEAGLKLKPSKCHFARREVEYLGHLVTPEGLKTNQKLVEAVTEFETPKDVNGVRRFLGMSSYYRRFINGFARIAAPLRKLTRKGAVFHWTSACSDAMRTLKDLLTTAPVLAYPLFDKPFTVETDACIEGLGAVLEQMQADAKLHPVAYASRSLTEAERNYGITELEVLAVVWALTRFHCYLYGHSVTVITDHAAVRAVLETPNPSAKHARWWTRVYGAGLKDIRILYRPGRLNAAADALSRSPHFSPPGVGEGEGEVQISAVTSTPAEDSVEEPSPSADSIGDLLECSPRHDIPLSDFADEQRHDPETAEIITYLETGDLPRDERRARSIGLRKSLFVIQNRILYYCDPKQDHRLRVVVPLRLRQQVLEEHHAGLTGGHFAAKKMYGALTRHWWWDGMYHDTVRYSSGCPQCAIVTGGS